MLEEGRPLDTVPIGGNWDLSISRTHTLLLGSNQAVPLIALLNPYKSQKNSKDKMQDSCPEPRFIIYSMFR